MPPFIFAIAHKFCASRDGPRKSVDGTAMPAETKIFWRGSQEKQILARGIGIRKKTRG